MEYGKKELDMAKILEAKGHIIYMLPENDITQKHPDAIVDGETTEFKCVKGNRNTIGDKFKNALKQADSVFIKTSDKTPHEIYTKLMGNIKTMLQNGTSFRNKKNVYVSVEGSDTLYSWRIEDIIKDIEK